MVSALDRFPYIWGVRNRTLAAVRSEQDALAAFHLAEVVREFLRGLGKEVEFQGLELYARLFHHNETRAEMTANDADAVFVGALEKMVKDGELFWGREGGWYHWRPSVPSASTS